MNEEERVTPLELDLLMIYYNHSDQFGVVDVQAAQFYALKQLNVLLPDDPFTIEQKHIDVLVKHGYLPNALGMIYRALDNCEKWRDDGDIDG